MADDPDDRDFYARFGDFLREVPEAEAPLRAWRDRQAQSAVKRALERERQRKLDEAIAWFGRRRSRAPDSDD